MLRPTRRRGVLVAAAFAALASPAFCQCPFLTQLIDNNGAKLMGWAHNVTVDVYFVNSPDGQWNGEEGDFIGMFNNWKGGTGSGVTPFSHGVSDKPGGFPPTSCPQATSVYIVEYGNPADLSPDCPAEAAACTKPYDCGGTVVGAYTILDHDRVGDQGYRQQVMAHEIGHSYGLDDCTGCADTIMNNRIPEENPLSPDCCDQMAVYNATSGAYGTQFCGWDEDCNWEWCLENSNCPDQGRGPVKMGAAWKRNVPIAATTLRHPVGCLTARRIGASTQTPAAQTATRGMRPVVLFSIRGRPPNVRSSSTWTAMDSPSRTPCVGCISTFSGADTHSFFLGPGRKLTTHGSSLIATATGQSITPRRCSAALPSSRRRPIRTDFWPWTSSTSLRTAVTETASSTHETPSSTRSGFGRTRTTTGSRSRRSCSHSNRKESKPSNWTTRNPSSRMPTGTSSATGPRYAVPSIPTLGTGLTTCFSSMPSDAGSLCGYQRVSFAD